MESPLASQGQLWDHAKDREDWVLVLANPYAGVNKVNSGVATHPGQQYGVFIHGLPISTNRLFN